MTWWGAVGYEMVGVRHAMHMVRNAVYAISYTVWSVSVEHHTAYDTLVRYDTMYDDVRTKMLQHIMANCELFCVSVAVMAYLV